MDEEKIKAVVLDAFEVSLEAQLKAIRRLKTGPTEPRRSRAGLLPRAIGPARGSVGHLGFGKI